jgi:hypothetical protein
MKNQFEKFGGLKQSIDFKIDNLNLWNSITFGIERTIFRFLFMTITIKII